jgi:tetratricopeptide (TPR) repeat protein
MEIQNLSDISYLLPSMTQTTECDSLNAAEEDSTLYFDFIVLSAEYQRSMKRGDYTKAIECSTQMLEMGRQNSNPFHISGDDFVTLHEKRAHAYIMAKEYDAAASDLEWIEGHSPLSEGNQAEVLRGMVQLLQGKDPILLQKQAGKGNLLAMLLANLRENTEAPKTEWMLLSREERIQKLVEGRHYEQVIEEIDKMDLNPQNWNQRIENRKWSALKGVCYALRGNYLQAINEFKENNLFTDHQKLAVVYTKAAQKERAEKELGKRFETDIQSALIHQWMEKN